MNQKEEILQWILELEKYARDQGLSMRILDSIEECKQHIYKEDLPWQALKQQIEDVMESVGLKVQQTDVTVQRQNGDRISVEKVQAQVRRMAEQCHRENIDSVNAIQDRKDINIRESIRQMGEIIHTEAHLEKILEKNQYEKHFQQIKYAYDQNMAKMAGEMVGDISGNYDHMADHMRSMFQSMGGSIDGIRSERLYHEYEAERDTIEKKLNRETQTADYGGSSIMEFASKTKECIQNIVKKMILKKRLFTWIPILLLLVAVISVTVVKYQERNDSETAGKQIIDFMKDIIPENKQEAYGLTAFGYIAMAMTVSYISNIIAFTLIFIVVYAFYLRKLKKWYNRRICENCETYLKAELAAFGQENQLAQKTDQAVAQIVEESEQQYLVIFNRIFAGTKYGEKTAAEDSGFEALQRKWSQLNYR